MLTLLMLAFRRRARSYIGIFALVLLSALSLRFHALYFVDVSE